MNILNILNQSKNTSRQRGMEYRGHSANSQRARDNALVMISTVPIMCLMSKHRAAQAGEQHNRKLTRSEARRHSGDLTNWISTRQ